MGSLKAKAYVMAKTLAIFGLTIFGTTVNANVPQSGNEGPTTLRPFEFSILSLNAFLLPRPWFRTDQVFRAHRLVNHLSGYDAIVFQELFDDKAREVLLLGIAEEYPYSTKVLGREDTLIRQDGGVVIVSRWPIEQEHEMTFGAICKAQDCLADKGVLYAEITKRSRSYHLFGIHAQSDFSGDAARVREDQFQLFHSFVTAQTISHQDPIILAGDFNVDCNVDSEFQRMLELLDAQVIEPCSGQVTWDGTNNMLVDGESHQFLDYVLISKKHLQPLMSRFDVLPLRSELYAKSDLSDHYAVAGQFVFHPEIR